MQRFAVAVLLLLPLGILAQTAQRSKTSPAESVSRSYANYSIVLAPSPNGEAVMAMYNPQGKAEFVPVNSRKKTLIGGYVPVRVWEVSKLIESLNEDNKRLEAENACQGRSKTRPLWRSKTRPVDAV